MGTLIYAMMVSLDGFISGPDGELDWHVIDEELHRHFNDLESEMEMLLYGRHLYETMAAYWPTVEQNPSASDAEVAYGRIWNAKPKIVFSKTLDKVEWNSQLSREVVPHEIRRLKTQSRQNLSVGGAELAATFHRLGLIDEYWLYVNPVVAGRGKPMFLGVDSVARLRLVETRPFHSGVVLLRYEAVNEAENELPTGIGKPAEQALAVTGYNRLEQLAQVSETEILKLHGVGPKAVGLLRQALAAKGLSFAK
ncbi:MAG: dihydrofolate reductase family protein [Chloroflexi bacterium]|nr:dihydrofolate reductase family protein [Chloroflexota bacterium]